MLRRSFIGGLIALPLSLAFGKTTEVQPDIETVMEDILDKYPLIVVEPCNEPEYVAYTIPNCGKIPNKIIYGEPIYFTLPLDPSQCRLIINRR
jgi:hypothetical protein